MRIPRLLTVILVCLLLVSCGGSRQELSFYGMSTYCSVTVYGGGSQDAENAKKTVLDCENEISPFVVGSDVSKLNLEGSAELSAELCDLLKQCDEVGRLTQGRYSVLSRRITRQWDFLSSQPSLPDAELLAEAVSACKGAELLFEGKNAVLPFGTELDPGSVGKGFACDRAVESLKQTADAAIVSVGGSIGVFGAPPKKDFFEIAVRDPFGGADSVLGVLKLKEGFVSTSGDYERFFELDGKKYHHILDCTTGYPFEGELVSVTAVSQSGGLSDLLSTACFLQGFDLGSELLKKYDCQGIFVLSDGRIYITKGLQSFFEPSGERSVTVLE